MPEAVANQEGKAADKSDETHQLLMPCNDYKKRATATDEARKAANQYAKSCEKSFHS